MEAVSKKLILFDKRMWCGAYNMYYLCNRPKVYKLMQTVKRIAPN